MLWLSWVVSNVLLSLLLAMAAWFVQRRLRLFWVAHVLWLLALVKLLTPPLIQVPLHATPGAWACALGICSCEHHAALPTFMRVQLPWLLLAVWSAGACATLWTVRRRTIRFRRLLTHASPAPCEWRELVERLSSELCLRRPPELLAVPGRLPPMIVPGRSRPHLLLPIDLLDQLNEPQRTALLLHELMHIKRGDHLVRILELLVGVIYWWLPVIGLIGRHLRGCEESCCDAAVVNQIPQARRDYARLLLDVLDFVEPAPVEAVRQATAMSASDLEHRLRAILDTPQGARRLWPAGILALCLACALLPCGLHYDLAARPGASLAGQEQGESGTPGPVQPDREKKFVVCCPS